MTEPKSSGSPDSHRHLLLEAASEFMEDRALRLGAGLAYYGLITLVPLLILLLSIVGLVVGQEAIDGTLADSLEQWFGADIAQAIGDMVAALDGAGSLANLTILSAGALIFGASVLFVAWKDALDVIWQIGYHSGVKASISKRLFGFASVGALAGVLIALLVAESLLAMLSGVVSDEPIVATAFGIAASIVPLLLGVLLLGAMYRFGTDAKVSWRGVWPGTVLTMVLLLVLFAGYGVYVDFSGTSVAGVASAVLLLLVLIYCVAQVLLYGAEVIKVKHPGLSGGSRL
jgi:membrane protein